VNAYFTGFGGAQRIVLYDTLLTDYTPDQIEVVLAHEMGHWYYHHVLLGLLGFGAAGWIGLFGLRWLLQRVWQPLGWSGPADVAGLPYLLAALAVVTTLALPVQNSLSRYAESQADRFALSITHKPETFITLFEKFAVQNLSVVDAPAWEKFVFYTHPAIAERIRMAEDFQGK
jgi:STE24 endopeptidase